MRGAYLLMVAPDGSEASATRLAAACAELARAPGWRRAAGDGLGLWVRNLPVQGLSAGGRDWKVVGRCWRRVRALAAPPMAAAPASAAAARTLLQAVWGGYVALAAPPGGEPCLLRDPSGALPAFAWVRDGLRMVASEVAEVPEALRPARAAVDWEVVLDHLRRPVSAAARPALAGVAMIAPGDLHGLHTGRHVPVWRPGWVTLDVEAPPAALRRRLREGVLEVCAAWSEAAGDLVLELSGGFDSSVVAAAMAEARGPGGRRLAVNFYVPEAGGDERRLAAEAAGAAGLPLRALRKPLVPFSRSDFDELAGGLVPAVDTFDAPRDRAMAELLAREGAAATVTGQGGDAVFFQPPCARMLTDALRAQGPFGPAHRLGGDLARRMQTSLWSVWAENLRPQRDRSAPWLATAGPPTAAPAHPWLADLTGLGPARRLQIAALADMQLKFGPTRRAQVAEVVHPLLAQPIVELALTIPPWLQVAGGRDRALARAAFADLLPPAIVARRAKGALTSHYARRLALALEALRPMLLDGALAGAGLLDRDAVAVALTPEDLFWRGRGVQLLRYFAVEAWLRRWG